MRTPQRIYLASDSPRRIQLLKKMFGSGFDVVRHVHIEDNKKKMSPERLAVFHAVSKAASAAKGLKKGAVIGADTIVVCGKKVLGKPGTAKNASKMLRMISGKVLKVITGVAVFVVNNKKTISVYECTHVKIKVLTKREVSKYVATKEPLDKAGAFAIQGRGGAIVEWIEGDYYNVVGLPIGKLARMMKGI